MLFNKKNTGLLLAGIAAYGLYKYNKMSKDERKDMLDNLKARGQKAYDDYMPDSVKNLFKKDGIADNRAGEAPLYDL